MRLWHQQLIPKLDRQRLLGQHRECAALRGKGWGKKHSVVDYAFTYNPDYLVAYHYLIMDEMEARGYHPDPVWRKPNWRGAAIGEEENWTNGSYEKLHEMGQQGVMIFAEHNDAYLQECIDILKAKGIEITM